MVMGLRTYQFDYTSNSNQFHLDYIVQGHRFDILEDVGCWPTIYLSIPAIPLVYIWPLIISLISVPYCGMFLAFESV